MQRSALLIGAVLPVVLGFSAIPLVAHANVASLPRTDDTIRIDGVLDEAAWRRATRIDIDTETRPGENTPAPVKTAVYLIEDGERLYVAFDAEDPDPRLIRAYLRDRDSAWNDDFVGIVLDTYNDERRAFEFFANPLGVQMDLTNDDVNGNEDASWDAIWDSAGRIHDTGYVVEMEIPFNQLRFPNTNGRQTWGIELIRIYPREHRYRLASKAQDRNRNCFLCQLAKIEGFEGLSPGRDLEIVPTLTASRSRASDEPGVVPLQVGSTRTEAGLSVRWGITPDLTANLAINPDFSQVEADVAQLEVNNQFALFFPEKRPFFLEGADYFSTPIRAVFTRTVADPSAGVKLTGKKNLHTFGLYAARDETTNLVFPGAFGSDTTTLDQENTAFVGRYARSFGDASTIGALVTLRDGDGYRNYVAGLDSRWKINDQHSVRVQYLGSETVYPDPVALEFEQRTGEMSGAALFARYDYESRDWFAYALHQSFDDDFRVDSGFLPQVGKSQQVLGLGRIWHGDADDRWTQMRLNGDWDIAHDESGRMIEREIEVYFSISGPLQSFVQFGGLARDALFDGVLFRESTLSLYGEITPLAGLSLGVWSRIGELIDFDNARLGDQLRVDPFVNWNVSRHLLLRFDGTFVDFDTEAGQRIFDARIYDVRATWQFNRRSFLRLTAQIRDVERDPAQYTEAVDRRTRDVGRQLLYSYKLNPHTVFFAGFSDRYVDDDELDGLTATDRTYFLKIGYAWTP